MLEGLNTVCVCVCTSLVCWRDYMYTIFILQFFTAASCLSKSCCRVYEALQWFGAKTRFLILLLLLLWNRPDPRPPSPGDGSAFRTTVRARRRQRHSVSYYYTLHISGTNCCDSQYLSNQDWNIHFINLCPTLSFLSDCYFCIVFKFLSHFALMPFFISNVESRWVVCTSRCASSPSYIFISRINL